MIKFGIFAATSLVGLYFILGKKPTNTKKITANELEKIANDNGFSISPKKAFLIIETDGNFTTGTLISNSKIQNGKIIINNDSVSEVIMKISHNFFGIANLPSDGEIAVAESKILPFSGNLIIIFNITTKLGNIEKKTLLKSLRDAKIEFIESEMMEISNEIEF